MSPNVTPRWGPLGRANDPLPSSSAVAAVSQLVMEEVRMDTMMAVQKKCTRKYPLEILGSDDDAQQEEEGLHGAPSVIHHHNRL